MDATRPRPRPDDDARAAGERVRDEHARPGGLRCPYCHDALSGAVGHCLRCGTAHHVACFAEHGGCSTHGCGSTRASTAAPTAREEVAFTPVACGACRDALPADAVVARCDGCGDALHVACYERLGACPRGAGCRGPVELMPHAQAAALALGRTARGLLLVGAAALALALLAPAIAGDVAARALLGAFFGGTGGALACAGLWLRARALRLAAAPPPPVRAGGKEG